MENGAAAWAVGWPDGSVITRDEATLRSSCGRRSSTSPECQSACVRPTSRAGRACRATLDGFDTTDEPACVTIAVDADVVAAPERPPHSELYHIRYWDAPGDAVVAGSAGLVLFVDGTEARAHLPDLAALTDFEGCVYLPLTWLLARHDRFMLHGAAVERDGVAVLVLGHSGAGKSTLAAAALEAGWRVLADDVVIVHRAENDTFRIHGVHRTPAFPIEIGGALTESATPLNDPRDRAELPRDVLTGGEHALAGVVLVVHSEHDEGSLAHAAGGARPPAAAAVVRRQHRPGAPGRVLRHRRRAQPLAGLGTRPRRRPVTTP